MTEHRLSDAHLLVLFFVPGLAVGGAERHTIDLRARLRRLGWSTRLLAYGPRRADAVLHMDGAEDVVQLDIVGMSRAGGWLRAWRALRRERPSVIVAVNQTPLIVAVLLRMLGATQARIVSVFHTTILRKSEERTFFLYRAALRLADALVFVSANQQSYWATRGLHCRRENVILNGIELSRFRSADQDRPGVRRRLGFMDGDYVVGSVSALRPEKNHIQLVVAVAVLRDKGFPARALLVGDGPMRTEITATARRLGIEEHVLLVGEHSDVRPLIAATDVGVLCSCAVETFSLAALEFLAMGVPMVMSDIGGASEIVSEGVNGFLFPCNDTNALIGHLEGLADPATRLSIAARAQPSVEGLSISGMVEQYVTLLSTLTKNFQRA